MIHVIVAQIQSESKCARHAKLQAAATNKDQYGITLEALSITLLIYSSPESDPLGGFTYFNKLKLGHKKS